MRSFYKQDAPKAVKSYLMDCRLADQLSKSAHENYSSVSAELNFILSRYFDIDLSEPLEVYYGKEKE